MQSATLNMTLADYEALKNARTKAEQDLADALKQVTEARLADPTGKLVALTAFARDCLTIARFAVGNLPPEMIRGWPHVELLRVAETLNVLPDFSINDRDMALDLAAFARDAEQLELSRKAAAKPPTKFTSEETAERRRRLEEDPIASALMERMKAGSV